MADMSKHRAAALVARATGQAIPNSLVRAANMGDVAYLMMCVLEHRRDKKTSLGDLVSIIGQITGDLVDPAHCFNTLKDFTNPEKRNPVWVKKLDEKIASPNKGKPIDAYVITKAGIAANRAKEEHLEAVIAFRKQLAKILKD